MNSVIEYIVCFLLFVICQSLAINGLKETFSKEHIFYPIAKFMDEKISAEWIKKPVYKCVRCMSSVWGTVTFWGFVIPIFGFYKIEIPIFIFDVFMLVYINYFFYKRQ